MSRAIVSLAVGFAIAAAGAVRFGTGAGALVQRSGVLDRTYRCAVGVDGGIRSLNVYAQTGVRDLERRATWKTPPHFAVLPSLTTTQFRVWAGGPVSESPRSIGPLPGPTPWVDTMILRGCPRVSFSVPFVRRELSGGRASPFGDRYQCPAPRTVLLRLRVEFTRPVSVGRTTRVPVRSASLAVRTASGRPIAYADVHESGRSRLFAANGCIPE